MISSVDLEQLPGPWPSCSANKQPGINWLSIPSTWASSFLVKCEMSTTPEKKYIQMQSPCSACRFMIVSCIFQSKQVCPCEPSCNVHENQANQGNERRSFLQCRILLCVLSWSNGTGRRNHRSQLLLRSHSGHGSDQQLRRLYWHDLRLAQVSKTCTWRSRVWARSVPSQIQGEATQISAQSKTSLCNHFVVPYIIQIYMIWIIRNIVISSSGFVWR